MNPEDCPVCWDIFYEPFNALPCKHLFCKLCFKQICARNLPCPCCRQPIKKWKYNQAEAIKVKEAFPDRYVEKLQEEKEQKLPSRRSSDWSLVRFISMISMFGLFVFFIESIVFWALDIPLSDLIKDYLMFMVLHMITVWISMIIYVGQMIIISQS